MARIGLTSYRASVTVLSGASELNSLANGSLGAVSGTGSGTILDNTTNLDEYADFEFVTGTLGANATVGGTIDLYWDTSEDGTNYETFPAAGTNIPPYLKKVGSFVVPPPAGTSYRLEIHDVPLIAGKMKFAVVNNCGQALPASGASVTASTFSQQAV